MQGTLSKKYMGDIEGQGYVENYAKINEAFIFS